MPLGVGSQSCGHHTNRVRVERPGSNSARNASTATAAAFPVGTMIEGAQLGAGQVTIAGAAGVTVNATPGLKVAARYGEFRLRKVASNTWLATGSLAA